VTKSEGIEAAELASSIGDVEAVVAFVIGTAAPGALDAKRTPAPFRIKEVIGESRYLAYTRGIEFVLVERSGLARMDPCCTVEEENFTSQQLCDFLPRLTPTCLMEKASSRRRPIPMV
jgi:hypothetical protein